MPHTPLTVFLVDDETLIRSGMKKLLPWDALGFSIVGEAENGKQALPLIEKLTPDLVITDLKMPLCDGITLTGEIKKLLPRTEVIILTGYDEFDYARQAIRMGVFDFLLKPISPDELQATLLRLQQKRSVRETPYPFEEESALLAAFENADTDAAVAALSAVDCAALASCSALVTSESWFSSHVYATPSSLPQRYALPVALS